MKITVTIDGRAFEAREPYTNAEHVNVHPKADHGHACGWHDERGLPVYGRAPTIEGHDTITCPAVCLHCKEDVGTIVVSVNTLFGIAEDRAVLCGRPRVY